METYVHTLPSGLEARYNAAWGDFLLVNSTKLPQTYEYIQTHGPVNLELNSQWWFAQKDLSFLDGIEHLIEGLDVVANKLDLRGIERLTNLKYLRLSDDLAQPVAFECFTQLASCSIVWNKHYRQATFPASLTDLTLRSYRPRFGFNGDSLSNLRQVTTLTLIQAAVKDLSLLQHCGALAKLDIAYSRTLTDISAVAQHASSLTKLELDTCKKIGDFAPLGQLTQLEWLNLCSCKRIPSVSFVQQLPALKHFVFYGTVVEDGDLSYLKGMPQVAFDNKAHYSLKERDFQYHYS